MIGLRGDAERAVYRDGKDLHEAEMTAKNKATEMDKLRLNQKETMNFKDRLQEEQANELSMVNIGFSVSVDILNKFNDLDPEATQKSDQTLYKVNAHRLVEDLEEPLKDEVSRNHTNQDQQNNNLVKQLMKPRQN
jgi:hypothetical protein